MKIMLIPVLFELFVPFLLLAAPSPELQKLLDQDKKEASTCKSLHDDLVSLAKLDDSGEHFLDKQTALKVLAVLETHQATTDNTKKIYTYVVNKGDTADEDDIDAIWTSANCSVTISYYTNLRKMLSNIKSLGLSPEESARLARETLKHVKEELSAPSTLLGVLVDTALLKLLVDQNLVTARKEVSDLLTAISLKGTELKNETKRFYESAPAAASKAQSFKDLPAEYRKNVLKQIKREFVRTEVMRKDLQTLLEKIALRVP